MRIFEEVVGSGICDYEFMKNWNLRVSRMAKVHSI